MNRKSFLTRVLAGTAGLTLSPLASLAGTRSPQNPAAPDLQDWREVRKLFPLTRDRVYLNTGGLGPPSSPVLETMREQALKQATRGETYHKVINEVRQTTADFLGADPGEVAFTRNASESNSIIAAGLDLRRGDEVIFESHAHPGGSFPWMVRQKEDGIRVRIFEPDNRDPETNLERIFELVNERTRVIQVSHITAPTGIRFDAGAIAREARRRGIWFHIDGAQSAGMIPLDLHRIGCDSFATSGHKWLNGPQESGILYIRENRIDDVACSHAGAYSDSEYELPDTFEYNPRVQRHEYGTRDAASIAGLRTALDLQDRIGRDRIARHGKHLTDICRTALNGIRNLEILTPEHPEMYNSILTFRIKDKAGAKLAGELVNRHNLRCRQVSERGLNAVRVSWHVYHTQADVERLAAALSSLA
jgi:selenocysteine lyase/cysteine desulfurase